MSSELIRKLRKKEDKTEQDWTLLKYHSTLVLIEEIVIDYSKRHLSGDEAVQEIRKALMDNLG